jgi:hypothetical protein
MVLGHQVVDQGGQATPVQINAPANIRGGIPQDEVAFQGRVITFFDRNPAAVTSTGSVIQDPIPL